MLKQQIPNRQLHKISHKTNPSLNSNHKMNPSLNSSHKMSPSLNSHKACLPVNNNQKAKHPTSTLQEPVPSQFSDDDETLPDAWTMARKSFATKIPDLYQRNQDIVYDQKQITFNPFCPIFSLQIKRKTSYILENSHIVTKCQVRQNFFDLPFTSHILA